MPTVSRNGWWLHLPPQGGSEGPTFISRTASIREALPTSLIHAPLFVRGTQEVWNQRPILEDAATTFKILTLGAFDDRIVEDEGDKQAPLARWRNGEMLRTSMLSSGTRNQLYLALRFRGHGLRVARMAPALLAFHSDTDRTGGYRRTNPVDQIVIPSNAIASLWEHLKQIDLHGCSDP